MTFTIELERCVAKYDPKITYVKSYVMHDGNVRWEGYVYASRTKKRAWEVVRLVHKAVAESEQWLRSHELSADVDVKWRNGIVDITVDPGWL